MANMACNIGIVMAIVQELIFLQNALAEKAHVVLVCYESEWSTDDRLSMQQ
jgi:hypothetical protein